MERFAVDAAAIEHFRVLAEAVHGTPEQARLHFAFQRGDVFRGLEHAVAPGCAGEDHIGAVAERDLPVLQDQHDRDGGAGLVDPLVTGQHRWAAKDVPIRYCAGLYRHKVAVHVARLSDGVNDFCNLHFVRLIDLHYSGPQLGYHLRYRLKLLLPMAIAFNLCAGPTSVVVLVAQQYEPMRYYGANAKSKIGNPGGVSQHEGG